MTWPAWSRPALTSVNRTPAWDRRCQPVRSYLQIACSALEMAKAVSAAPALTARTERGPNTCFPVRRLSGEVPSGESRHRSSDLEVMPYTTALPESSVPAATERYGTAAPAGTPAAVETGVHT